jgi:peptidoglycan/xylan/chitin deacetylase (PgdA/CDA1 family)
MRIPILYYHEVGKPESKHVVSPEAFEEQLAWLADAGFVALSMDDVLAIDEGRRERPERPVALTFDDGRAGVGREAAPRLLRRGMPATFYVVTGWLDGRELPEHERYSEILGWDEVLALSKEGFCIGSHGVSHANLKRIPLDAAAVEISASKRRLEEALDRPVPHFSFPYGRSTRAVRALVREAGYRTAVVTGERTSGRFARLHHVPRLRVDGREPLEAFRRRVAGA